MLVIQLLLCLLARGKRTVNYRDNGWMQHLFVEQIPSAHLVYCTRGITCSPFCTLFVLPLWKLHRWIPGPILLQGCACWVEAGRGRGIDESIFHDCHICVCSKVQKADTVSKLVEIQFKVDICHTILILRFILYHSTQVL